MDTIVTLKLVLLGTKPPIWRRLEVPSSYHLGEVHDTLNAAMGWLDYHLHAFKIDGRTYSVSDADVFPDLDTFLPEESVVLGDLTRAGIKRFEYIYDFGDDWRHSLIIEKTSPAEVGVFYPRCVAGRRAAPPEDCGGLWGFDDFMEAMADPEHPDHADITDDELNEE
jgi:hypothetical protein